MRALNRCRFGRRVASSTRRRITWWSGVGTPPLATKVCRIKRQSASLVRRCPTSTLGACARGQGGIGVHGRGLARWSGLLVEQQSGGSGGDRRVTSRLPHPPTPFLSSLLATNESSVTARYRGAR
jgi:hypothetical protein